MKTGKLDSLIQKTEKVVDKKGFGGAVLMDQTLILIE